MSKDSINIEDFNSLKVTIPMEKVIKKYGRKAAAELRGNPSEKEAFGIKKHRVTNEYFSTWRSRFDKGSHTSIVYNKKNGRLTYLLEKGHAITNAKGGIKWTRPHKHISVVYDKFKGGYIKEMKRLDVRVDLT